MSVAKTICNFPACFRDGDPKIMKRVLRGGVLLLLSWLVGCAPLKQIEWKTSTDEIRIGPAYGDLDVSVLTKTTDPSQKPNIDVERSYAISPTGNRYSLRLQTNDYSEEWAKNHPTPWFARELYLVDPSRKNDAPGWVNGAWELNLFFTDPIARPPIHAEFRLYTYWWFFLFERPF